METSYVNQSRVPFLEGNNQVLNIFKYKMYLIGHDSTNLETTKLTEKNKNFYKTL